MGEGKDRKKRVAYRVDVDMDEVRALWDSGETYSGIANKLGVSCSRMKNLIEKDDSFVSQNFMCVSKAATDPIIDDYVNEYSVRELVLKYGKTRQYIVRLLQIAGVFVKGRELPVSKEDDKYIVVEHESGDVVSMKKPRAKRRSKKAQAEVAGDLGSIFRAEREKAHEEESAKQESVSEEVKPEKKASKSNTKSASKLAKKPVSVSNYEEKANSEVAVADKETVEKPKKPAAKKASSIGTSKPKAAKKPSAKKESPAEGQVKDESEVNFVTREEKVEYCNKKYGKGNWKFMTREEVIAQLRFDMEMKKLAKQEGWEDD